MWLTNQLKIQVELSPQFIVVYKSPGTAPSLFPPSIEGGNKRGVEVIRMSSYQPLKI